MKISPDMNIQTVITTYDVTPGKYLELLDELQRAFESDISKQDGFISGAIHTNDAQTRIANYTQWQTRAQFLDCLRSDEMQEINSKLSELSKAFEPVLYEVQASYATA